jgi:hypothetical protein
MTSHACTTGAVQLDVLANDLAYMLALIGVNYTISRLYHLTEDSYWWSHVGGFQNTERRTDDEVELVPFKDASGRGEASDRQVGSTSASKLDDIRTDMCRYKINLKGTNMT